MLELPLTVYIPGLYALPETRIFISLTFFNEMKTSVPIYEDFTLALIRELASLNDNPNKFIGPISGKFIVPSLLIV